MNEDKGELSEAARRRKRINLYKRVIIIMIVTIILLPTILCIILFCRMSRLQKDFSELKAQLESSVQLASDENSPDRKQIQASLNKNQAEPENSSKTYRRHSLR